jgi:hypothetical protein
MEQKDIGEKDLPWFHPKEKLSDHCNYDVTEFGGTCCDNKFESLLYMF